MKRFVATIAVSLLSVAFAATTASPGYHGSSKSNIYHVPACAAVKKILQENLVVFPTKDDAAKKNYRPCKICKP